MIITDKIIIYSFFIFINRAGKYFFATKAVIFLESYLNKEKKGSYYIDVLKLKKN